MHRLAILTVIGLFAGSVASAACAADGMPVFDAAPDAVSADAAAALTFETQVTDLSLDSAVFDVNVTDVLTGTTTTSAPNGRAVLTLGPENTTVKLELNLLLSNTTTIAAEALASHNVANQPLISYMTSAADLDNIYARIAVSQDSRRTQLLLQVRGANFQFAPVTVIVNGSPSFVRDRAGEFTVGDQPIADPLILIPNVPGSSASIDIPSNCLGPRTVELDPGHLSSAFFVCP